MTLYHCTPLSAKISKVSCKANKHRGVFACEKCPGLGDETKLEMEGEEMGTRCLMPGCEKWQVAGNYCTTHADPVSLAKENTRKAERKEARKSATVSTDDEFKAAGWVKKEVVYPEQAEVIISDSEIHTINLLQVLRAKLQADMDEEMTMIDKHLGLLTDPVEKMKYVFDRVYS
jgi:hypothetical protein